MAIFAMYIAIIAIIIADSIIKAKCDYTWRAYYSSQAGSYI